MPNPPIPIPDDDQLLWKQFREGNALALGTLAKRYYRILFHYGTKFTKDTVLVEDCIQDIFLKLWDRRMYLGDTPSVKFYLLKTLRHHLIKTNQKHQSIKESFDWDIDLSEEEHAESLMIQKEIWSLTSQKLKYFVADLPKRQQEALYLRYYEDLSYDQIAQIMGINTQSVANLLQHSLKRLRDNWHYTLVLLFNFFA